MPLGESELESRFKAVAMLLLDVDGVLTDGCLLLTDSGQEFKPVPMRSGPSGL